MQQSLQQPWEGQLHISCEYSDGFQQREANVILKLVTLKTGVQSIRTIFARVTTAPSCFYTLACSLQDYGKFGVVDMDDKQKLFRLTKRLNMDPLRSLNNGSSVRGQQTPRPSTNRGAGRDSSVDSLEAELKAQMLDGNAALLSLADDSDDYLLQVRAEYVTPYMQLSLERLQAVPLDLTKQYRDLSWMKISMLACACENSLTRPPWGSRACPNTPLIPLTHHERALCRRAHPREGKGSRRPRWPCHRRPARPQCCRPRSPTCPRSEWSSGNGPSTGRCMPACLALTLIPPLWSKSPCTSWQERGEFLCSTRGMSAVLSQCGRQLGSAAAGMRCNAGGGQGRGGLYRGSHGRGQTHSA